MRAAGDRREGHHPTCKGQLVNTVARGRTTFDFAAEDGQTLSFSGSGAQHEATEETEQLQPISLIVSGLKNNEGIVRSPAPAVGACRFLRAAARQDPDRLRGDLTGQDVRRHLHHRRQERLEGRRRRHAECDGGCQALSGRLPVGSPSAAPCRLLARKTAGQAGATAPCNARDATHAKRVFDSEGSMLDANPAGALAGAPPAAGLIKDTTTAGFRQDVIAESMNQPVIVDFWAPWCGPCKQLTPVLEKVVTAAGGRVKLAKLNIDEHPGVWQQIGQQLGLQSIPAVIAIDRGRPVDAFMGAVPESEVRAFVDRLAGPSEIDQILEEAAAVASAGDLASASELYAAVLREEPTNLKAIAGLAKTQLELGETENARQVLAMVAGRQGRRPGAGRRARRPRTRRPAESLGDLAGLQRRIEAEPTTSGPVRPRARPQRRGQARRGGGSARCHRARRPHVERGCGPQAAAPVLRGLGADGPGRDPRAPPALDDPVLVTTRRPTGAQGRR